ncbi:MAG: response regulator [Bacteroidales bacterium]|nr:response regulator [Bacteroidales bacterium]
MSDIVNLSNKNILVVEDDEMNFIYLSQIFKLTKGNITRVKNGKDALSQAKENKFDIILMDIQLPDINGNTVTKQIREFDNKTPIIAQTASRSPEETDETLEAGCTDVLVKPFTIEDFSKIIGNFI